MGTPPRTILAAALVAVAACGGVLAISSGAGPTATAARATFTVSRATVGRPIPAGFVGLSMEYRGLQAYAGRDPRALNPVFVQLVRNLAPAQSPVLRIGGDSSDWTWSPVRDMVRPPGVKFDLTRDWLQVARALSQSLGARLILGINLEADSTGVAAAEAQAFLDGIGRKWIEGLEIGNEPELYGSFGWYKTADGRHIPGRPRGYDFAAFLRDFSTTARSFPHVALAGPSTGSALWIPQLEHFLVAEPRVGVATLHRYPLKHCHGSHVTLGQLLSDPAVKGLADSVARYASVAHAYRLALRIDEMNAVSCGGQHGVSDVFGSALWAVDALFQMARVGVDGVNFHTVPNTINELISASFASGKWRAQVHPQYYGMMMFARAAPPASRLLRIDPIVDSPIKIWATQAPDGQIRIVVINKDTTRPAVVTVRVPWRHSTATLERLQAPSVTASTDVTLGGQGFGAQTDTGSLTGSPRRLLAAPSKHGYVIRLTAASAAMLTLPKR